MLDTAHIQSNSHLLDDHIHTMNTMMLQVNSSMTQVDKLDKDHYHSNSIQVDIIDIQFDYPLLLIQAHKKYTHMIHYETSMLALDIVDSFQNRSRRMMEDMRYMQFG